MKGFAPFTPEELKIVKEAWRLKDLELILTGDPIKDIEIIKEYNNIYKD